MLNNSINYPYPILRSSTIDYKSTTFTAEIPDPEPYADGYRIKVVYSITNPEIQKLVVEGKAAFALQVYCISTWYRRLKVCELGKDNFEFELKSNIVHNRVDLCPCIVAQDSLKGFYSDDFQDDFVGMNFDINPGEVIGIGDCRYFDAVFKKEIIPLESIVQVVTEEQDKVMSCDFDKNYICVHLPEVQYNMYISMGLNEPWKTPILNAICSVPAIAKGIEEVSHNDSELVERPWFKSLKYHLHELVNNDEDKYKDLFDDPIKTAQLLLHNNSGTALDIISKSIIQQGEEK